MPELPEVETVKNGLAPVMEGFAFDHVTLNRPDLRFPFDPKFIDRVQGQTLSHLSRRAKFLDAQLGSGDRLLMHLGMSGRFSINQADALGQFAHSHNTNPKHDHVIFVMSSGAQIVFNDPRRFGFMLISPRNTLEQHPSFVGLGVEPVGNALDAETLALKFSGKRTPLRSFYPNLGYAKTRPVYLCFLRDY